MIANTDKFILDLKDKFEYVCDYRILKRFHSHGVQITKVHYVYEYAQDYILQDYIDFNTKKRASAKNDFEKDFFKLSNNSIYGKMLQDILKQNDCVITTDDNVAVKHFSDPAFKSAQFAEETYFISKAKKSVKYGQ